MLHKRLTKVGNSLALLIDKPILELLGIDAGTVLDVTVDAQGRLVVAPVRPATKRAN